MADAGEEFWRFSLAFYARPGVSPACLALQDRHGRDVNLVLYAGWVGLSGRGRLTQDDLARAEAVAAPWRGAVIEKLRAARRAIKEAGEAVAELYAAAKALELEAERVAHRRLAALAPSPAPLPASARAADAHANLRLYLAPAAGEDADAIFAAIDSTAASL